MKIPKIGLRNLKTALAVVVCLLLFLPFWGYESTLTGYWELIGPVNAVVAAILCMQHSIESSWRVGGVRLLGTLIGGVWGCAIMTVHAYVPSTPLLILLMGLSIIVIIWFCLLIKKPMACNVACIIFCLVVLVPTQPGLYRYLSALARMGETAVGIVVAVIINFLLPGERLRDDDPIPKK